MTDWKKLATDEEIKVTQDSLSSNGIESFVVQSSTEAKQKVLELIPKGSEVMTMTSVTLDSIGISEEINRVDGDFKPVRDSLYAMDRNSQKQEMNKLGSAPEFAVGSVQAITKDGKIVVASNTGSQIPAYAYGALNVIFVVGVNKITASLDEAMERLENHTLPLESERAKKAYGVVGSSINKLLIINKEVSPGRIKVFFVKEELGY